MKKHFLSAEMSATDAAISKKMYRHGAKTIKYSNKNLIIPMLLGTLGASLLSGRGLYRAELKKGAYIVNLEHSKNTGTHRVVIFVKRNEVIYFDSFGVEHISEEIKMSLRKKNIKTNIFRIQGCDSIMCGYFCILFIEFMLNNKPLTDFTNLFSPNDFKKHDEIIKRYFS